MKKAAKAQALSISIVIPVYNDQSHLKACLDSIKNQTIAPDEVVVVDNNSTDESVKVAKTYPFVRVVAEKQQGVPYARTKGFNSARSTLIGRIDADTQLPADWVSKIKHIFEDEEIAAVSGPVGFHDAPSPRLGLLLDKSMRKAAWRLGTRDDAVFLFGSNMAMRKSAWDATKDDVCYGKDIHEDIDIAIHLDQAGYVVAFDEDLTALASSRRIDDPTKELYNYLRVYKNTYTIHDIQSPAITFTIAVVLSGQYGVKFIKRFYDPETKQLSLKKFLESDVETRVQPMG